MILLITGGLGYIGSHVCVELLKSGHDIIIIDNLSNSSIHVLENIKKIVWLRKDLEDVHHHNNVIFYNGDVRDEAILSDIFKEHSIDAVLHFAGLKSVSESLDTPIEYYDVNISGGINLLNVMKKEKVKTIVFSSSAVVYGDSKSLPIKESTPLGDIKNPYGYSKLFFEQILKNIYQSDPEWKVAILRYFNPVGAHPSGRIGENPNGIPNNLMPLITQVVMGKLDEVKVFGSDYPTIDGTGVRDYIHVVDLAIGHVAILNKLFSIPVTQVFVVNLGSGIGYSVLQMIKAYEKIVGRDIPYSITKRREGDIAESWTSIDYANEFLGWRVERNLHQICLDTWNYEIKKLKKND